MSAEVNLSKSQQHALTQLVFVKALAIFACVVWFIAELVDTGWGTMLVWPVLLIAYNCWDLTMTRAAVFDTSREKVEQRVRELCEEAESNSED